MTTNCRSLTYAGTTVLLFKVWYITSMKTPSTDNHIKGEIHGCIVCGKPYQLYVVYDAGNQFIDCKVMSAGGKRVPNARRPLVACEKHSEDEIAAAVHRVYGRQEEDD